MQETKNQNQGITKTSEKKMVSRILFPSKRARLNPDEKISMDSFREISVLGRGSFGTVVHVRKKGTREEFAIKKMPIVQLKKSGLLSQVVTEVKIMSGLSESGYIIKLHDHFEDERNLYLVMELAEQGPLMDLLNKFGKLREKTAVRIMKDIVLAVEFLHTKNIIHRDIKPENILIDINGKAKLADFGWSSKLSNHDDTRKTFCGTPDYISPEMIEGKSYDNSIDIWCLGVMLYEMLTGVPPFTPLETMDQRSREKKLFENIKKMKLEELDVLQKDALDLIKKMM